MLDGGAQRVLDRAAVEAADRLELVERDDDLAPPRLGEPGRQREHLLRQPRDVAVGPHAGKRHGQGAERPARRRRIADLGARRPDRVAQPGPRAVPLRLGRDSARA